MGMRGQTDFTHVRNLVEAFSLSLRALEGSHPRCARASVAGQAFFVTDGQHWTTLAQFTPMLHHLGFPAPISFRVVNKTTGTAMGEFFDVSRDVTPEELDAATVVMGDAWLPVPRAALWLAAVLLESVCMFVLTLSCGRLRLEPFLTRADVRKLYVHNCFSSKKIRDVLRWKPVVGTAEGMRELIQYYDAFGYDGRVHLPAPVEVAAVVVGLSLLACLALDVGGCLSHGAIPLLPAAWREGFHVTLPALGSAVACTVTIQLALKALLFAAVAAHVIEAMFAASIAWDDCRNAPAWALLVLASGFPAIQKLLRTPSPLVVPVCLAGFAMCLVAAAPMAVSECRIVT
jgi:hypothetical protein